MAIGKPRIDRSVPCKDHLKNDESTYLDVAGDKGGTVSTADDILEEGMAFIAETGKFVPPGSHIHLTSN